MNDINNNEKVRDILEQESVPEDKSRKYEDNAR